MLFSTPAIDSALARQLDRLDQLRTELGDAVGVAAPWLGVLRRESLAAAVTSSVSIEGYAPASATAIAAGRVAADEREAAEMAVACYAHAMDHVGAMAIDPAFRWSDRVVLDLHFDACSFQRDRKPGLWRTGPVFVTGEAPGSIDYTGPDAERVSSLMAEVVAWLEDGDIDAHVAVRAAMAHLHVVSVHPFSDGNGRVSRIVQSLVLALSGVLAAEFGSIEPYLAAHTKDYYAVLRAVQAGSYDPRRDARSWVEFCVDAHIAQAAERLAALARGARRWAALEELAERRGWPDRFVIALEQSVFADVTSRGYRQEADVSHATATIDLRELVEAGFLQSIGHGRSRRYRATDALRVLTG